MLSFLNFISFITPDTSNKAQLVFASIPLPITIAPPNNENCKTLAIFQFHFWMSGHGNIYID